MRYFLIILFAVISFFAAAQASPQPLKDTPFIGTSVTIPVEAARFFLERDDIATALTTKDSVSQLLIVNLREKVTTQSNIIVSYKADSVTYRDYGLTKNEEIDLLNQELKLAKKEANKQKFLKVVGFISTGIVILITFIKQ